MVPFIVWFMTGLWGAEAFVSVCGLHGGVAIWAFVASVIPALLVQRALSRYRLRQAQRATAWQSPPPGAEWAPPKPRTPEPPPVVAFPVLKLRALFSRAEVVAAFRRRSMELHPDHGGNVALFRMLVAERDRALAMAR